MYFNSASSIMSRWGHHLNSKQLHRISFRPIPFEHRIHVGGIEVHTSALSKYVGYYNGTRTHLSLTKDAPEHRSVQGPSQGRVVEVPRVGGLHLHEAAPAAAAAEMTLCK